eukprot:TRINITY_DN743_c0_g1_i3.p1 TRINITY_DN743_c0_g1~~TRINITY_DN743_c0_g1_i3.p1  ORF type:complete len:178 (+),score=29.08 TRINITY_DN743_c0_g1_i3:970-1503(+)
MKAYIVEAYLEAAAVIIDRMCAAGVQPTIPTWTAIIQAADALGDPKRADELYSEALECGASKPHIPWHRKAFHDTSGRPMNLSEGTIMDLHRLTPCVARVAVRHELQARQNIGSSGDTPLYIITGLGGGQLRAAVSDALKAHGIYHFCPAQQRGLLVVPATDNRSHQHSLQPEPELQ